MSNPLTLGGLALKLTAHIPQLDAGEARRRINVAYVNEAMGHSWSHLLKRWTLQTEPSYATGTLSVTNASNFVTLSGDGAWVTGWTTSPSMRRVAIQGRFEPYDITITGANTGTLADPWIGETNPTANYAMWRDTYALPTDCGFSKMMALYDPMARDRLKLLNQATFIRMRSSNPGLITSYAGILMMVNQTTENPPRPQFQMWPNVGIVRAYHGWYFRRPDFMPTDATYPDWPHEFQDMLWLSAAIEHYSSFRFNSPKYLAQLRPKYADLYAKMVKEMDGNSAIDVEIESIFTGRTRAGSNANWTPNVLGWGGSHMTNS